MNEPVYDLRGHYAGFVSRLMAFLIDRGIIWAIVAMAAAVTTYLFNLVGLPLQSCHYSPTFPGVVCLVVQLSLGVFALSFAPLYTILFWTLATQTPGKYVMGLRIYRMNGERLTFRRALRRYVGYLFSFLAFGLGFFWITIDDQRQGFHDIFADTCVVYSWDAFQNQRIIHRMSMKLFGNPFFQNPEPFYAQSALARDASEDDGRAA